MAITIEKWRRDQEEMTKRQQQEVEKQKRDEEEMKKRHQREQEEHLMLYPKRTEAGFTPSPGPQLSSLGPKKPSISQSHKTSTKRPLTDVRDWRTSLELDGSTVRWMLCTSREYPESKRQHLDNASHTSYRTEAPAKIKKIRYDQVRSNAIQGGHWDTIVEWPSSSGQFWVLFCVQHNMHFKSNPLLAAAKHINGQQHGALKKDWTTALIELGYYITDCSKEQERSHNAEVQDKLEKGYRPPNHFKKMSGKLVKPDIVSRQTQPSGRPRAHIMSNPKPFHVYYCYYKKQYWACLILGWDEQIKGCPFKTLEETALLEKRAKPPKCYIHNSKMIFGWQGDFKDGGPKVNRREIPIMYFDGAHNVGWAPATSLSKMDLTTAPEGREYPEASYNEAREWIATTAGYSTWEEYRASGVDIRKLTPEPTGEGQDSVFQTTHPPSDESESEVDEVLESLRSKGGDDSDDEDYRDDGRGFKGGRLWRYVTDYEDDDWTLKYNLRQEGVAAAKSLAEQAGKSGSNDQKSGPGPVSEPTTRPSTGTGSNPGEPPCYGENLLGIAPDKLSSNGTHASNSEPRPSPGIGAVISDSIPPARQVASMAARRTKSTGTGHSRGSSEPEPRLPDLRTRAPDNISNGTRHGNSEPLPSPGIGANKSDNIPQARPVAGIAAQRSMSTGAGLRADSLEPQRRLPELPALVTAGLFTDNTRDVNSAPPGASSGPRMETATSDDRPFASRTVSTGEQKTMSAGPMTADSVQQRISASSRTTMSSEAMTVTPNQSSMTSPVSAVPTPMAMSASPRTSATPRPRTSGRVFEITKYADTTRAWERADRAETCVKLYPSEDEKTVGSSDERISILIDPQQCRKPQVETIEGREGMSLMTLPQASGEVISMVFDRSRDSRIELGKIQARHFVRWLQAQNAELR